MNTMQDREGVIAAWLDDGPASLPEDTRQAITVGIRTVTQRRSWLNWPFGRLGVPSIDLRRLSLGLGSAAVVVLAAVLALNVFPNLAGLGGLSPDDPRRPFVGVWISTSDADGGTQTMTVRAADGGGVETITLDTIATVCSLTPSTMTGTGRIENGDTLVIPEPVYTCDDGSTPEAVSGPPLADQLRNFTLVRDPQTDTLGDGIGGVWSREGAAQPTSVPTSQPTSSDFMWPQSNLDEVRQAQGLADTGDPDYTWQVDPDLEVELRRGPYDAEILARFIREELGWGAYVGMSTSDLGDFVLIRCASGTTNSLYPDDPDGVHCAPTIDELRYETVQIDVAQPVRQDATGIWVVTGWAMTEPFEQVAPPSEAETTALLEAFLQARIDGQGVQNYVRVLIGGPEIPFLYATPTGAPYERYEFEVANGPAWPDSQMRFKVQLFAEDGDTVVEQFFLLERVEQGLWYESETGWPGEPAGPGTTVNGQIVPVPHSLLGGEVTLRLTYPWRGEPSDSGSRIHMMTDEFEATALLLGSLPITTGCLEGPAPADAEALAQTIRSSFARYAAAPVTVMVGGLPALRMDLTTAPGAPGRCQPQDEPLAVAGVYYTEPQARFYLVDLPEGSSSRILVFAVLAQEENFEGAVESVVPIVDSIEFHPR